MDVTETNMETETTADNKTNKNRNRSRNEYFIDFKPAPKVSLKILEMSKLSHLDLELIRYHSK